MGQYANFYNSHDGDRVYDAESMSEWLTPFFTTGVFDGDLFVQENNGMSVSIDPGYVNIKGKVRLFDESIILPIEIAHATLSRIDNIVVRRDDIERNIYVTVVKGTNSSNPVAPSPVREEGIYDLVIAHVHITPALAKVTQSQIEDTRASSSICGWVVSTVKEISFDQIMAQWKSIQQDQNAEFEVWFNSMKDQLSEDAAGYLQSEIEELKKSVSDGKGEIAAAITQKKVAADSSDSFAILAEKILKIALGSGSATKADVLSGKTFTNSDGIEYTGTMPNNGAVSKTFTPSTVSQSYVIPAGYHSGTGKVNVNPIPSGAINCIRKGSGVLTSSNQVIDTASSSTKKGVYIGVFNGTGYIDGSNDNSSWTTLGTYADGGSSSSFTNSSTSGYLQNQTYRYIRIRFVSWNNGIAGKAFYSVFSAG